MTYTPRDHPVHGFKQRIRLAWIETGRTPFSGPVSLTIKAVFERPARLTWAKKSMPAFWHTTKPDWDNVGKAVSDALNGLAFADDAQVARGVVEMRVAAGGESPQVEIIVATLQEAP